jgi:hypothetical protein
MSRRGIEAEYYSRGEKIVELEAEILRLRSENARIRKAAEAVIQQWDTPNWKLQEPTAKFINALRAELSQANTDGGAEE